MSISTKFNTNLAYHHTCNKSYYAYCGKENQVVHDESCNHTFSISLESFFPKVVGRRNSNEDVSLTTDDAIADSDGWADSKSWCMSCLYPCDGCGSVRNLQMYAVEFRSKTAHPCGIERVAIDGLLFWQCNHKS